MTTIKATVHGGRLEIDVPPDWPDGIEVEIHPLRHGIGGNADAMSREEIARTLTAMDQVEPFDLTEVEQAAWDALRRAEKQRDQATFAQHGQTLRGMWE